MSSNNRKYSFGTPYKTPKGNILPSATPNELPPLIVSPGTVKMRTRSVEKSLGAFSQEVPHLFVMDEADDDQTRGKKWFDYSKTTIANRKMSNVNDSTANTQIYPKNSQRFISDTILSSDDESKSVGASMNSSDMIVERPTDTDEKSSKVFDYKCLNSIDSLSTAKQKALLQIEQTNHCIIFHRNKHSSVEDFRPDTQIMCCDEDSLKSTMANAENLLNNSDYPVPIESVNCNKGILKRVPGISDDDLSDFLKEKNNESTGDSKFSIDFSKLQSSSGIQGPSAHPDLNAHRNRTYKFRRNNNEHSLLSSISSKQQNTPHSDETKQGRGFEAGERKTNSTKAEKELAFVSQLKLYFEESDDDSKFGTVSQILNNKQLQEQYKIYKRNKKEILQLKDVKSLALPFTNRGFLFEESAEKQKTAGDSFEYDRFKDLCNDIWSLDHVRF